MQIGGLYTYKVRNISRLHSTCCSGQHLKCHDHKGQVKMKTIINLMLLALLSTVANAETYKWEDANGIHFTDNASSVPEKYRKMQAPEIKEQPKVITPQVSPGIVQYDRPTAMQPYLPPVISPALQQFQQDQAVIYQANLAQQRRAAELMRQQQARALAVSTRNVEKAANSLAKFMAIWFLIGLAIFVTWISTIVDIVKSEFVSPSNKTVWMLLVFFLPLLGMLFYFVLGNSQKCKPTNFKRNNWEPYARDNGRGFKGKGPDIY